MATNVIPIGPTFDEVWWSTEPQLHSFDYEAGTAEGLAGTRASGHSGGE